jgi:hypothetical protein
LKTGSGNPVFYYCVKIKRQRGGFVPPTLAYCLWFCPKGLLYDFFPALEEV